MNRPLLLLLATGAMLGLNFPLGKLAIGAGVEPALWAALISLGAGLTLLIVSSLGGGHRNPNLLPLWEKVSPKATDEGRAKRDAGNEQPDTLHQTRSHVPLNRRSAEPNDTFSHKGRRFSASRAVLLRYAIVSGFVSYVVPNFLTFSVIPKIGSGLAAIMFALSPVATAALSILLKVRPPSFFGIVGIALGLLGALVIIVSRSGDFSLGSGWWIAAALLIPVFLGMGNVYRTLAWPEGARPRRLAALTNLAAVPPLLLAALVQTGTIDLMPLAAVPGLVALQIAVSTIMFLMLFRLQQLGGPTYLSQMGYVAAAVGVVIGVTWFGETYPAGVWVGTGIIAGGIALSTFAQVRQAEV